MVNCAAIALHKSELECRCLPIGISMIITSGQSRKNKKDLSQWVVLDPNNQVLTE